MCYHQNYEMKKMYFIIFYVEGEFMTEKIIYPHIERPWMKFYDKKLINSENPHTNLADYIKIKNQGNKYDLILMDIMMPNMSGETALAKLKENHNFKTPVIALTADAVAGAQEKYRNEGFIDYIAKPFSKDEIIEKISLILKEANNTVDKASNSGSKNIDHGFEYVFDATTKEEYLIKDGEKTNLQ